MLHFLMHATKLKQKLLLIAVQKCLENNENKNDLTLAQLSSIQQKKAKG